MFLVVLGLAMGRAAAAPPRFEADVLPVLYRHCFSCHSEKQAKPKAGLRLDSAAAIDEAGVIVPGKPDASELLKRVSLPLTDADVMPPLKGGAQPLSDAERALVREWITAGADLGGWIKFEHRQPPLEAAGAPLPGPRCRTSHARWMRWSIATTPGTAPARTPPSATRCSCVESTWMSSAAFPASTRAPDS